MHSFRSIALVSLILAASSCSEPAGPSAPASPTGVAPGETSGGTTTSPNTSDDTFTSPSSTDGTGAQTTGGGVNSTDDTSGETSTTDTDDESSEQTSDTPSTGVNPSDGTSDNSDSDDTSTETTTLTDDGSSDDASNDTTDATDASGDTGDGTETDAGAPDHDEDRKFVGNITTRTQVDAVGLQYSTYWDQITPENAGKWGSVQATAGANYNWGTVDAIYDYAQEHGLIFKQHAFVWGRQEPGNAGALQTSDVQDWMQAFCSRYPRTKLIDVVNEPPPHTTPAFADNIGGGTNGNWQWITNAFIWARERCPNAILILNDFNNIEWPNDNQHFIDIVNTVLSNGGPIDALGAQAHDLDHGSVTFQRVQELLNKLHNDTGLPVYITEMDLDYTDDQRQLEQYQQYFPYFMETEFIPGITIWGWIYGRTWASAPNSGLVRDSGQPRPAMTWLMNELGRPVP